jgi:hypothetical protein
MHACLPQLQAQTNSQRHNTWFFSFVEALPKRSLLDVGTSRVSLSSTPHQDEYQHDVRRDGSAPTPLGTEIGITDLGEKTVILLWAPHHWGMHYRVSP